MKNLSNKAYNILSYIALVALPAIAAFYLTFSGIWNLPNGKEIVATLTAIDALLGALLKISSVSYNKSVDSHDGTIAVPSLDENGMPNVDVKFFGNPADLMGKDTVRLKVDKAA